MLFVQAELFCSDVKFALVIAITITTRILVCAYRPKAHYIASIQFYARNSIELN